MKWHFFLLLIVTSVSALGQVEHNFRMDPQKTDCHLLPDSLLKMDSARFLIENATYRLKESITISRYYEPNSADYYSCDGKTGYLIVQESADHFKIFSKIPVDLWEAFTSTNDPIGFYKDKIKILLPD